MPEKDVTFNRTILELKLNKKMFVVVEVHTFNRTILELKLKRLSVLTEN